MIGIAWSSSRKDGWLFPARRWASTGPGTIRGLLVFERQRRRAGPLLQCSDEQLPRLVRGAAGQRLDVHDPRRGDGLPRVVLDGQPLPVDDGDDDVGAVGVVDEVLLDGGEAVGLVVLGQGRPHAHSHAWCSFLGYAAGGWAWSRCQATLASATVMPACRYGRAALT